MNDFYLCHVILIGYYLVKELLQKKKPLCMFLCNIEHTLMEAAFSAKLTPILTYLKSQY